MLQELAQYLVETGKKCVKYEVVKHPTDQDQHFVIGPDGVRTINTERQRQKMEIDCYSADDFVLAYTEYGEDLDESPVWYNDSGATAYSKDIHRIVTLTVDFPAHPAVNSVLALSGGKVFDQRSLVRFLRVDLAGRVEDFVLARMRQLNWDTARKTRQALQHGSASLDSEVKASVTAGEAAAPEEFYVEVPLFADPHKESLSMRVKVLVELDPETAKIALILPPGTESHIESTRRDLVLNFLMNAFDDKVDNTPSFICGEARQ